MAKSDTTLSATRTAQGKVKLMTAEAGEMAAERAARMTEGSDEEMNGEEFSDNFVEIKQKDIVNIAVGVLQNHPHKRAIISDYIENKARFERSLDSFKRTIEKIAELEQHGINPNGNIGKYYNDDGDIKKKYLK